MAIANQRRHERIKHRATIKVLTRPDNTYELKMRDFSESGLFLFCEDNIVDIGDEVEVQTQELEDAPILKSKVVRVEKDTGFAVEFFEL